MILSLAVIAALSTASSPAPAPDPAVRRFALIAGANDGGTDRVRLRYATTDAQAFAKVLTRLGGVEAADQRLLLDPDRAQLERAIGELGAQMARSRGPGRSEVLVYYSGHSDEDGLLLKGDRLGYRELRAQLETLPADVRIVVLDSCASGAVTRAKGGVARPSFLTDASSRVRGHAFLTSSSADELAQESDRLEASFFTHYLVSGLRGAADTSRDGKVTLNEAYHFAFQETLARTERTRGGPQHPAFDIQLVGSGDLVMTDLRGTDARLAMAADVDGRVFVRRTDGPLAVEVPKVGGQVLELGLEPGTYDLTVEKNGEVFQARFELAQHGRLEVGRGQLTRSPSEATVSRGGALRRVVLNASFVPALSLNGPDDREILNHFSFNVVGRSGALEGLALSLIGSWIHGDMAGLQFALGANAVGGVATGAQLGGLMNSAGALHGLQLSAGLNRSQGEMRFAQLGAFNWTAGAALGLQLGAVGNRAATLRGLQAAGGLNVAGDGRGAQLGALNVAGELSGAQLGVVNLGNQIRGLQLGLVNVSEDADATLGLVNVVRARRPAVAAFYSETWLVNANLRSGGRYLHSLFTGGYKPGTSAERGRYLIGAGLGAKLPLQRFYLGGDLTAGYVRYVDEPFFGGPNVPLTLLSSLKVNLGWQLTSWASLFAGASVNHLLTNNDRHDIGLISHTELPGSGTATFGNRLFPGFHAGAEF